MNSLSSVQTNDMNSPSSIISDHVKTDNTHAKKSKSASTRFSLQQDGSLSHHVTEKRIISFSHMNVNKSRTFSSSKDEIDIHIENEKNTAESMCLELKINDIDVSVALVDQGASRSVMRSSCFNRLNSSLHHSLTLHSIKNMYVVGSTNEYVPVKGCFLANISTKDDEFIVRTMIYVVNESKNNNIICDMVLGRSSISQSIYSCIDTTGSGSLLATGSLNSTTKRISCSKCVFILDSNGESQLSRIDTDTGITNNNINNNTASMYVSSPSKLHMIKSFINTFSHLSLDAKSMVFNHMVMNEQSYDIHEDEIMEYYKNYREKRKSSHDTNPDDNIILCHLMSSLDKSTPNSDEEKEIISALFASFIPDLVKKKSTKINEKVDSMSTSKINESKNTINEEDEVDAIEFPFISPTIKIDTKEYHDEKHSIITKMIDENDNLSRNEKNQLIDVLIQFSDRFSIRGENMERTDSVQHEIDTKDRKPFRERLRQYAPAVQKIIDDEVQAMLKQGVISLSKSPYASNLLLVRKPDSSSEGGVKNRVCASFVQLNDQTEKDSYPLPNIQYIFDRIGRSKLFTTMDLLSGFWQVMIRPEHRHKTAFITMRGLYEFVVMPFGLCNAPATFQRLMDAVILPEYRSFIETYIDDLMTHSHSFSDHVNHIKILLNALRKHNLVVKLSKCKFAQKEVKFLGHLISFNSIKTNPEAVSAIKRWMKPEGTGAKAVTAIRSFLGMAGWYRKFIPNFAHIAKPLYQLTKINVKFEWTNECQKSFELIRDALVSSPVLAVADANKSYVLHTDASDVAMGAILMQTDDEGNLHPIAYASKSFNTAQMNYDTTEREALAIVWALEHFNTYCEGHRYTLLTDHQALSFIRTNKDTSKRITRWNVLLQRFQIDIFYQKGKDNHAADLLSRKLMKLSPKVALNVFTVSTRKRRVHFDVSKNTVHSNQSKSTKKTRAIEWEVEKIIDKRIDRIRTKGTHEFLVKWKNYDDSFNSWEPSHHLKNAVDLIVDYEKSVSDQNSHNNNNNNDIHSSSSSSIDHSSIPSSSTSSLTNDEQTESKNEQSINDESNDETYRCFTCDSVHSNEAALYIHRFHDHQIQVPTDRLRKMKMNTDFNVFKMLQQSESEFREIFNTDLGTKNIESLNPYDRRNIVDNEFILSDNGLLYMIERSSLRSRSKIYTQLRLCIPKTERRRLLNEFHDECAHPGVIHLYEKLREQVWWPRMLTHIVNYVQQCNECQRSRSKKNSTLPRPMSIPSGPFTHIAIDHIGPFPMTNDGHKYILVMMCRFTKYVEAYPTKDESAYTTAQLLVDKIICRFGFPEVILSDRGSGFSSSLMQQVLKQLSIKKISTTSHHPQSNGGVEIVNKSIKKTLKIWINEHHNDWDVLLPFAIFSYNTSFHSLLRTTPYYLNHGRHARTIVDSVNQDVMARSSSTHVYAYELSEKLFRVHRRIREIYEEVNKKREDAIEKEKNKIVYQLGDRVWLHDPNTPIQKSKKFVKRWKGPFIITKIISDVVVTVMKDEKEQTVNIDRVRPLKEGLESIEDKHMNELEVAKEELRVINESIELMKSRKTKVLSEMKISEAGLSLEKDSDSSSNEKQRDEDVNNDSEMLNEADEENSENVDSVDSVRVNAVEFRLLW